jgi:hypothetical protein
MHYQRNQLTAITPDFMSPATALDHAIPRLRNMNFVSRAFPNHALLIRALALAKAEVPWLVAVQVHPNINI